MRTLLMTFLVTISGSLVYGQETFPKPGPEHQRMAKLAGEWDTVSKTPGSAEENRGKATYKSECNGLWLTSNFEGSFGGEKFQGKGLDSYDPATKKYVSVWVDSMITSPMVFEGDYDQTSNTLKQTAKTRGPDGKPVTWRSVTRFVNDNQHEFTLYMTPSGGTETLLMEMSYTRRK